jgi:uncharacterized protein (TIGR02284 family)
MAFQFTAPSIDSARSRCLDRLVIANKESHDAFRTVAGELGNRAIGAICGQIADQRRGQAIELRSAVGTPAGPSETDQKTEEVISCWQKMRDAVGSQRPDLFVKYVLVGEDRLESLYREMLRSCDEVREQKILERHVTNIRNVREHVRHSCRRLSDGATAGQLRAHRSVNS